MGCRLRMECDQAKRTLSSSTSANIHIDALSEGIDFARSLSRARFEEFCMDYFMSSIGLVEKCLFDSGINKGEVDEIVLVGGSTYIPKLRRMIQDFFNGKTPMNINDAAVQGAAVAAAMVTGTDGTEDIYIDVTQRSFCVEIGGGVMSRVIERNTSIPTRRSTTFTTHADNQSSLLIQVYEGESFWTKDNDAVMKLLVEGIPPARRGVEQIEVTFEILGSGTLTVSAQDRFKRAKLLAKNVMPAMDSSRTLVNYTVASIFKKCGLTQSALIIDNIISFAFPLCHFWGRVLLDSS